MVKVALIIGLGLLIAACSVAPSELRQREPRAVGDIPRPVKEATDCISVMAAEQWRGSVTGASVMAADGKSGTVTLTHVGVWGVVDVIGTPTGATATVWIVNDWIAPYLDNDQAGRDLIAKCGAALAKTG